MILVDTSVWVDHLRAGDSALIELLERGAVLGMPSWPASLPSATCDSNDHRNRTGEIGSGRHRSRGYGGLCRR